MTTFKPFETFSKLVLVTNILLTLILLAIIGEASGIFFGCLAFFTLFFTLPLSLLLTRVQLWRSGHSFLPQTKKKSKHRIYRQHRIYPRPKDEKKGFRSSRFTVTRIGLDHNGEVTAGAPVFEI